MVTVSTRHLSDGQAPADTGIHRAGKGTPLVLLHGANMSWRAWRPVLPFLTGRHDVFVPTLAGHRGGPVPDPNSEYNMIAILDTLCEQLDMAGIESAHLAGNSLGGWAAIELARRGRARSVTAISPAGSWQSARDLTRLLLLCRMARTAMDVAPFRALVNRSVLRRAWLSWVVEHPDRLSAAELTDLIADAAECSALSEVLSGRIRTHPMERFDVALCPVRIAWAGRDRTIPYRRYGHPMRAFIPGAEFVMLPGVGHVPMFDDPRLVARTILEMTTAVDEALEDDLPAPRRRAPRPPISA